MEVLKMIKHGLNAENIFRAFPDVLKTDEELHAIAQVVANLLAGRQEEIELVKIYSEIDKVPEPLLDLLAYDFKVDWYGYDYAIDVKREQFKESFQIRQKLGTPGAMELALRTIYPHTDVEEWFEYGGDPYYFRVILDITNPKINLSHADAVRTIMWFKNKRSHLEGGTVVYRSRGDFEISTSAGYVIYGVRLCGTYPVVATQGSIERHNLVVMTDAQGMNYVVPFTNDLETGVYPYAATQGVMHGEILEIIAAGQGLTYETPKTGTKPEVATQGKSEIKQVEIGEKGDGVGYATKFCGTTLGSL